MLSMLAQYAVWYICTYTLSPHFFSLALRYARVISMPTSTAVFILILAARKHTTIRNFETATSFHFPSAVHTHRPSPSCCPLVPYLASPHSQTLPSGLQRGRAPNTALQFSFLGPRELSGTGALRSLGGSQLGVGSALFRLLLTPISERTHISQSRRRVIAIEMHADDLLPRGSRLSVQRRTSTERETSRR